MSATISFDKRISNIEGQVKQIASWVEKASKPTTKANVLFGPPNSGSNWGPPDNQWPVKQLEKLAQEYNDAAAVQLVTKSGRPRLLGWGKALQRIAGIEAPSLAQDRNYHQEHLEKEHGFTSVQRAASHGIKMLNNEVRKVALAEGSGVTGGYVVPPHFVNELLAIAAEDAFFEPRARVIPMNSRTMTLPMLDITTAQAAGTSPYFGGILAQWQPEAASINQTEPAFRQSEWTAYDLVLYTVSSAQLLQDNAIGLDALLTQLFGQAITWYKEYAYLRGLGAGNSMPLGIVNAGATHTVTRSAATTFRLVDAAAMMSRLHARSWDNACWIMHQSVLPQLIQFYASVETSLQSGLLTWLPALGDGKVGPAAMKLPQVFLNGLPVYFTEKLPTLGTTGDVILADLSMYVIGTRLDMQIDMSPHFLFRNNQLAWRVVCRCDGKPWLNSTITDASGWVQSPFVMLGAA